MQFHKYIAAGALLVTAPFAQQALALGPTAPVNVEVFTSGSSAQQASLGQIVQSMCANDGSGNTTLDIYLDGTKGPSWRAYFCTLNPATSGGVSGNMLFHNRAKGGSIWGVVPVNRAWNVEYMNINNGNCTQVSAASGSTPGIYNCAASTHAGPIVSGECQQTGAPNARTGFDLFCHKSDGGISDVDPAMFIPPNLPSGWSALSASEQSKFTFGTNRFSEYGVIFGLLATEDVYRDMQQTQGLVTYTSSADPTDWSEAKRPNLTTAQATSIFKGDFTNWKDVNQGFANAGGTFGAMAFCRRTAGSGTLAGANARFLESPCRTASQVPGSLGMVGAGVSQPGYQVVENAGTGDLLTCLNNAYSATNFTAASGAVDFLGIQHGGIGFAGIEINAGATPHPVHTGATPDHYDFVKIDGVSPTVANAISGDYNYWFEQSIQWLKTADGGPSGSPLTILTKFKDVAGNPATINSVPINGVAALSSNGWTWDNPANYPTMRGTRNGNSCQNVILNKDNP